MIQAKNIADIVISSEEIGDTVMLSKILWLLLLLLLWQLLPDPVSRKIWVWKRGGGKDSAKLNQANLCAHGPRYRRNQQTVGLTVDGRSGVGLRKLEVGVENIININQDQYIQKLVSHITEKRTRNKKSNIFTVIIIGLLLLLLLQLDLTIV